MTCRHSAPIHLNSRHHQQIPDRNLDRLARPPPISNAFSSSDIPSTPNWPIRSLPVSTAPGFWQTRPMEEVIISPVVLVQWTSRSTLESASVGQATLCVPVCCRHGLWPGIISTRIPPARARDGMYHLLPLLLLLHPNKALRGKDPTRYESYSFSYLFSILLLAVFHA